MYPLSWLFSTRFPTNWPRPSDEMDGKTIIFNVRCNHPNEFINQAANVLYYYYINRLHHKIVAHSCCRLRIDRSTWLLQVAGIFMIIIISFERLNNFDQFKRTLVFPFYLFWFLDWIDLQPHTTHVVKFKFCSMNQMFTFFFTVFVSISRFTEHFNKSAAKPIMFTSKCKQRCVLST